MLCRSGCCVAREGSLLRRQSFYADACSTTITYYQDQCEWSPACYNQQLRLCGMHSHTVCLVQQQQRSHLLFSSLIEMKDILVNRHACTKGLCGCLNFFLAWLHAWHFCNHAGKHILQQNKPSTEVSCCYEGLVTLTLLHTPS